MDRILTFVCYFAAGAAAVTAMALITYVCLKFLIALVDDLLPDQKPNAVKPHQQVQVKPETQAEPTIMPENVYPLRVTSREDRKALKAIAEGVRRT